ncbi:DNA sulfur modification protein DndE [Paenibacillus roseipurpureus]|uniref:DNA sulfur modification protein DndE n=1 Tax=Paenibacillus roseopurpureus TaxID=2918901 RepID=A0AA96LQ78_9BACL|nr:DNA sulfur modification protein DndE [Paenibacillus sp. MBLB1832]WNR45134.1 DNA sulfur modification protein DndE [Paenibacillus sp. MBLB1832]
MNFSLKTSKYTAEALKQLQSSTNITPNILIRYAVALSLKNSEPVSPAGKEALDGLALNRNTVTGEFDYIFHALIAQHLKREITDEEYFPGLFNAHLERGIRLLSGEYKMAKNSEGFFRALLSQ